MDGMPPANLATPVPGIYAAGDIRGGSMKRAAAPLRRARVRALCRWSTPTSRHNQRRFPGSVSLRRCSIS